MRKVIVNEWMSLDGIAQAPGSADEDTSGGFQHGGWHLRHRSRCLPGRSTPCPSTWCLRR
jgi:hypothetical protein